MSDARTRLQTQLTASDQQRPPEHRAGAAAGAGRGRLRTTGAEGVFGRSKVNSPPITRALQGSLAVSCLVRPVAAMTPWRELAEQLGHLLVPRFEQLSRTLAEVARQHPELLGPPAKPDDPIARARHGRGTGPALPGMDGRRRR